MKEILLTAQGKKELEQRLNELKNKLIPEVVERIKFAKEQGDLSENAEYHAAREEQGHLEREKADIEEKLKFSKVVTAVKGDVVGIGATVTYLDVEENEEYTFEIVGTTEANLAKGKISNVSPVGQAMIGKKVGDVCLVAAPKGGSYEIQIKELKY